MTSPPGVATRLFVVEQGGRIRIIENDALISTPFLDISTKIRSGGEEGLLSMAFHPQYAVNGRFYVYFTNSTGDLRIVRYNVSATNPSLADEATVDTVIKIPHPTNSNHNGGQLQFGPDGKLYAATGDGGAGGDPDENAQNKNVLLGKLLRLDVDGASSYEIPPDNPFAAGGGAAEIWAFGLRNPWRFSFDRQNGDLYIGDVGQVSWEEVDVAPTSSGRGKGLNFGWDVMEGNHCFEPSTGCNQTGLTLPVLEYSLAGTPCAIVGGYVYRSARVPALAGHYLYSDNCAPFVKSFQYAGGVATNEVDWSQQLYPGGNVSSFGEDSAGDVYILTLQGGVYRIVQGP